MKHIYVTALCVLCCCSVTRQSHINLARGKATHQSSQAHVSRVAVDGNENTDYGAGSCTHSDEQMNPWWSVDLQHRYAVGRVDITNRGDCCPERLRNIRIGATDRDPRVTAPSLGSLRMCTSRDSPVGWGVTARFFCASSCMGRYLVVLLEGPSHILTMCEVQVFALRKFMRFRKTTNARLVGHVITSMNVRGRLGCAKECVRNAQCGSFNLQYVVPGSVMQCELNADTSPQQTAADLTAHTQWTFHQGTVILDD